MMKRTLLTALALAALLPWGSWAASSGRTLPKKNQGGGEILNLEALPKLNIVYLVPKGVDPLPDYRKRLGRILAEIRDFYNRELARHGSPAALRMPIDPKTGLVALTEVRGSKPHTAYPYKEGWKPAIEDVEAFYRAHPEKKYSDLTLVIIPSGFGTGVPFYGLGNYCFALDYKGFDFKDCGKNTPEGKKFKPWYGGMAHELGHGLGLPHTHTTRSQQKLFGTALMGAGNRTLGFTPTCLTPGCCAILESCPVCRVFIPRPCVLVNTLDLTETVGGRSVRIRGTLPPGCTVRRIVAAYDKDVFGDVNDNYDAESFVVPFDRFGHFDFLFPLTEIFPGKTEAFQIQLRLVHEDGTIELIRRTIREMEK